MGFLNSILQDIRISIRTLTKNRGFWLSAIAVLAIGIGATTVMFSVVYSLMLEPFIYKDSKRLVTFSLNDLGKNGFERPWFYIPEFQAIREQNRSFEDLIGYRRAEVTYGTGSSTRNILPREWIRRWCCGRNELIIVTGSLPRLSGRACNRSQREVPLRSPKERGVDGIG